MDHFRIVWSLYIVETTPLIWKVNSGPSRRTKDIKTTLDSWSLLMNDDILLEIVTNSNKNIEAFVNEHVGFDENDKITCTKPTDIHEIRALIGLFYLRGALNQNLHSVKYSFSHSERLVKDIKLVDANEDDIDMMLTSYVVKNKSGKRNILLLSTVSDDVRCCRDERKKPNTI